MVAARLLVLWDVDHTLIETRGPTAHDRQSTARSRWPELAARPSVQLSVLTGNLRAVARIKLEVFGLDQCLDLAVGAYGDDDADRSKLARIAQGRTPDRLTNTEPKDRPSKRSKKLTNRNQMK